MTSFQRETLKTAITRQQARSIVPVDWSENTASVLRQFKMVNSVGILFQGEDISWISSLLYISENTACRVINLYLSSGDVHPNKQCCGPLRKLSDHKDP